MSPLRLAIHAGLLGLALLAGCSASAPPPADRAPGTEQFVSQAPGTGAGGRETGAPADGGGTGTAITGAPTASPARAVEEADVYRLVGSTLYVLNGLRGLQIVDLADLDQPRLLGRLPVVGQPVDLYLRGTTAVFAVSDALAWAWVAGDGVARPRTGSQIWTVDVADPAAPRVVSRLDVDGFVEQTRFVGDVLYVFSRRWAWYDAMQPATGDAVTTGVAATGGDTVFLQSFDFADPAAPRSAARVDFSASGWSSHVAVTSDRIVLAQSGWDPVSGSTGTHLPRLRHLVAGRRHRGRGHLRGSWPGPGPMGPRRRRRQRDLPRRPGPHLEHRRRRARLGGAHAGHGRPAGQGPHRRGRVAHRRPLRRPPRLRGHGRQDGPALRGRPRRSGPPRTPRRGGHGGTARLRGAARRPAGGARPRGRRRRPVAAHRVALRRRRSPRPVAPLPRDLRERLRLGERRPRRSPQGLPGPRRRRPGAGAVPGLGPAGLVLARRRAAHRPGRPRR